ncbi:MAG: hypothetical protein HQK49_22295 [Oligoflexia bacterium]|nr:hypothetical protein [Oligoflexia bacterium]
MFLWFFNYKKLEGRVTWSLLTTSSQGASPMKFVADLLIIFSLAMTFRFGAIKFYQTLEKDLAIKLSKGLPSLSLYTDKLINPQKSIVKKNIKHNVTKVKSIKKKNKADSI